MSDKHDAQWNYGRGLDDGRRESAARIKTLESDLTRAVLFAQELIGYVPDYFRNKHGFDDTFADIVKTVKP